ncbi:MAG: PorT family protein [Mucilaginibacter sp.]|nr:PorT family protein [Mucilaginibacter sp.]
MLLICMAGSLSLSVAQSVKLSVNAGLNLSSYSGSELMWGSGTSNVTTSALTGFHAGIVAGVDVAQFSIQPGLLYTTKGSNYVATTNEVSTGGSYTNTTTDKQTLNYLQLPVNVLYNIPVTGLGKLFIGGGPYAARLLSGKDDFTSTATQIGTPTNIVGSGVVSSGNGADNIKKLDYGANALVGIAFKNKISFSAGYDYGLAKLSDNGYANKNHTLSFSAGYWFL